MIEVDCRKCINCTGEECIPFGKDADVATKKCAEDNFRCYVTVDEIKKCEKPQRISTRIGFLCKGDVFIFDGKKYQIRNLIENSNGYVACIDIESKKVTRLHMDVDVEVEVN